MTDTILIVFNDRSLGGTSRSALLTGKAWRAQGYEIVYLAESLPHVDRGPKFREVGGLLASSSSIDWDAIVAVHFHHGLWDEYTIDLFKKLSFQAMNANRSIPLITHNIFGQPAQLIWPGPVAIGVLGVWQAMQYRLRNFGRIRIPLVVVPNPQDHHYFRPPTKQERRNAKELHDPDGRGLVLRVGSPHDGKWSENYRRLSRTATKNGLRVIYVGASKSVIQSHRECSSGVAFVEPRSDDSFLRSLYWAADVFALDARQGESFGNVILESLACNLPVVYRARPYRDNTPWEFQDAPLFHYSGNSSSWIESVVAIGMAERQVLLDPTSETWLEKFSVDAVSAHLQQLLSELQRGDQPTHAVRGLGSIGLTNVMRVALRHNPIVELLLGLKRKRKGISKSVTLVAQ